MEQLLDDIAEGLSGNTAKLRKARFIVLSETCVLELERAHGRRVGAWLHARQWVRAGQPSNATAQRLRRWDGRECFCLLSSAPRALRMHAGPPQDGVKALLQHIESDSFGRYLDAQQVTPAETIAYSGINGPAGCALLFLLA
jgi:hypothetical protein